MSQLSVETGCTEGPPGGTGESSDSGLSHFLPSDCSDSTKLYVATHSASWVFYDTDLVTSDFLEHSHFLQVDQLVREVKGEEFQCVDFVLQTFGGGGREGVVSLILRALW